MWSNVASLALGIGICAQEHHASAHDGRCNDREDNLRFKTALYQSLPTTILCQGPHIEREATNEACQSKQPEYEAQRKGQATFKCGGLILKVEGYEDGDSDYC